MSIFSKMVAKYKYKKAMKKTTNLLNSCMSTYKRNEELLEEARQLIEKDKKLQEENKKE